MNHRNWLDLSRKLVDRFDMDYSFGAVNSFLGQQALSYFGEGVLPTKLYPTPFPITLSGINLTGSVGTGVAYDPNGQLTEIATGTTTPTGFTIPPSDPSNPRWDLLVLRYVATGQVQVPKPSDPIVTIFLNLVDDFQLAVIEGTPAGSPVYPAKGPLDIILNGFKVPAAATIGTSVTVDLSVRDVASALQVYEPLFKQERPAGAINGSNTLFTTSLDPLSAAGLLVMVDDLVLTDLEWSFGAPNIINLAVAPAVGQTVYVYYIANDPASVNPLMGFQEIPAGAVNGINDTFTLTNQPSSQQSTMLFVDGVAVETTDWSLIQGVPSKIQFQPGAIPATGQNVYIFYLTNANTGGGGGGGVTGAANIGAGSGIFGLFVNDVANILNFRSLKQGSNMTFAVDIDGTLIISSTGGGGGSREVHGKASAPIAIAAFLGLTPTSATDQVWWVTPMSGSGQVLVTATPPISPGGRSSVAGLGDRLVLKSVDSADYLRFPNVAGVDQDGDVDMGPSAQTIGYTWDGASWSEDYRKI